MASTLADSERRRLEDELKKTLLKACDDSDKADYSTKSFRNSMAKDGPEDVVSRMISRTQKQAASRLWPT
jgi:hypothetical protein